MEKQKFTQIDLEVRDYFQPLTDLLKIKMYEDRLFFVYPGWNAACVWRGELPDGVYYIRRVGCEMSVSHPSEGVSEWRLKEKAEAEFEIKNGRIIRFRPHYPIFDTADYFKNILAFERSASRQSTPNPHYYENR